MIQLMLWAIKTARNKKYIFKGHSTI